VTDTGGSWPTSTAPAGANYSVLAAHAGAPRSYIYNDNPVSEHEAIAATEAKARAAKRGLWGACPN